MLGPRAVAGGAAVAWPIASHVAVLAGRPQWMPSITALAAVAILAALCVEVRVPRWRAVLIVAVVAVAIAWHAAPAVLLFLPPVALNAAFAFWFGSTLREGREPRIARYARLERGGGELPPDIARYTRRLTWIWTAWFVAAALLATLLAAIAPLEVWSAFANMLSYVVVGVLFVGEYGYRRLRFPHHAHAPLAALIAVVARDRPLASRREPT